jgi:sigma-B regulation protein RsbU (phosphoserine phosphatase)
MIQRAENFGRLFSPLQVGYIADCIEPLNAGSEVGWVLEMIADRPDLDVVPIERNGAVLGVVSRKVLEKIAESAWARFWQKDLDAYLIPARATVEASTYIGKITEETINTTQGDAPIWFIVQHKRAYLGVVSLSQMTGYINTLRSQDLKAAGEIQKFLLGKSVVTDNRLSLFFYNQMAHEIGGDFYRVFAVGPDRYVIACFDASGKNISGAMATMALGSCFTAFELFKYQGTPEQITNFINFFVREANPTGIFVTAVLFYIDFSSMAVKIHNCGYSPVLVFVPQKEEKKILYKVINPNLPPLGIQEDQEVEGGKVIPITKGLRITAYSDGLTDMTDIFGNRYGDDQAAEFLKTLHSVSHKHMHKTIESEIDRWKGDASLADDVTLVDMRFI